MHNGSIPTVQNLIRGLQGELHFELESQQGVISAWQLIQAVIYTRISLLHTFSILFFNCELSVMCNSLMIQHLGCTKIVALK